MQTILCVALSAALLAIPALAEKRVIKPPEFGRQGQDVLPFNPGILDDGTLYISGQVGGSLETGRIPEDFEAEVRQCLENIRLILKAADMDYEDLNQVQVFLTDMSLFSKMNAVYASIIKAPRPTRVTVGTTALAVPGAHIEISAIASKR